MKTDYINEVINLFLDNTKKLKSSSSEEKEYNEKYKEIAENNSKEFKKNLKDSDDKEKFLVNFYMTDKSLTELRERRRTLLKEGKFDDHLVRAEINSGVDFYSMLESALSSEISNK